MCGRGNPVFEQGIDSTPFLFCGENIINIRIMKKRKLYVKLFVLLGLVNTVLFTSCNSAPIVPNDVKWISDYHQSYFTSINILFQ